MNDLKEIRVKIDEIDRKIVDLLIERNSISVDVINAKKKAGLPIVNKDREKEVIDNAIRLSQGKFDSENMGAIFRNIIEASIKVQKSIL